MPFTDQQLSELEQTLLHDGDALRIDALDPEHPEDDEKEIRAPMLTPTISCELFVKYPGLEEAFKAADDDLSDDEICVGCKRALVNRIILRLKHPASYFPQKRSRSPRPQGSEAEGRYSLRSCARKQVIGASVELVMWFERQVVEVRVGGVLRAVEELERGSEEYKQVMALYNPATRQYDTSVVPAFLRERYMMQQCSFFHYNTEIKGGTGEAHYALMLPLRWK